MLVLEAKNADLEIAKDSILRKREIQASHASTATTKANEATASHN